MNRTRIQVWSMKIICYSGTWALNLVGVWALMIGRIVVRVLLCNWLLVDCCFRLIMIVDKRRVDHESWIGLEVCAFVGALKYRRKTGSRVYSHPWIIYLRRSVHTSLLQARRMSRGMWWKSRDGSRCSRFRRSVIWSVPRIIIRLYWLFRWMQRAAWDEIATVVAPRIVVLKPWLFITSRSRIHQLTIYGILGLSILMSSS